MQKILIVDDNEVTVKLCSRLIAGLADTETVAFTDPAQALRWCKTEVPALVVVDYRMPAIDGVEFIRRLRAEAGNEEIPVIMLTAADSADIKKQAVAGGAKMFLMKPVNKTEFLSAIMYLLPGTGPASGTV